jgi:hypothetical protein
MGDICKWVRDWRWRLGGEGWGGGLYSSIKEYPGLLVKLCHECTAPTTQLTVASGRKEIRGGGGRGEISCINYAFSISSVCLKHFKIFDISRLNSTEYSRQSARLFLQSS